MTGAIDMAGPSLKNLKGIGPHTLGILKKHGITSLQKLAQVPLDTLVAIQGFGNTRAQMIKDAANALLKPQEKEEKTVKPEPAHISAVVVQEASEPAAKIKERAKEAEPEDAPSKKKKAANKKAKDKQAKQKGTKKKAKDKQAKDKKSKDKKSGKKAKDKKDGKKAKDKKSGKKSKEKVTAKGKDTKKKKKAKKKSS